MLKEITDIINFGKTVSEEKWSTSDAVAKLFEEGGELSTAAQIKAGKLPHKEFKPDNDFEESADVILCTLDVLCKCNPDMPTEEILEKLRLMLIKKFNKWKSIQIRL